MKTKKELDVDFIGGQEPLSKKEEEALSEFFQKKKLNKNRRSTKRTVASKKNKIKA